MAQDAYPHRRAALRRPGLYAITDTALCERHGLASAVEAALRGGAVMVQYRDKSSDPARRRREADIVVAQCARYGALSIINDDVDLALASDADGVHLGKDDASLAEGRLEAGRRLLIGVSCYNQMDTARSAAAGGADYVAFGSFFSSPTKPAAVRADPVLLRTARAELDVPVTAIGGITAANAAALIAAGASHVSVISGVFDAPDVEAAAREITELFESNTPQTPG